MPIKAVVERVRLTRRQRQVVALLAEGYSNREIAEQLDISLDGAKWHVGEILLKLNVNSREAAAAWWIARGESPGHRSRSLWGVALALPWKLAAAIGGMFGSSSAMRPRIQTDHAALLRDTAVMETWQPPPPPSSGSTANSPALHREWVGEERRDGIVPDTTGRTGELLEENE